MKRGSVAFCLLLIGCQDALVDESYGSVNYKSINGFDLMREHLQSKYDVQNSSFLDTKKLSQYDLVIYVQTELAPSEHMIALDRQIAEMVRPPGVLPLEESAEDVEKSEDEPASEQSSEETESEGTSNDEVGGDTDDADEATEEAEETEAVQGEAGGSFEEERPVALLILQRGTTASRPFWSRQWTALSPEKKRARDFVAERILADGMPDWLPESSFFFERELLDDRPFEKRVYFNGAEQAAFNGRPLPARIPAGLSILPDDPDHIAAVYRRSIAAFSEGSYFVEATVPGAYLFLVSDSAPFLNYHLMRGDNAALLDFIIDRSMKYSVRDPERKPRILILDRLLTREERMQEERSLFSVFLQPPWNLSAALLLLLFALFVWSRLLRDRPVTAIEPESSEGDLMKHFEGVGRRIAAIAYRNRKRGGK